MEIFADAGQVSHNWNIELPEVIRIADTGEQEKLGRFDGACTNDGFVLRPDGLQAAVLAVFHAETALAFE